MNKPKWHNDDNYDCPATALADTIPGECICSSPKTMDKPTITLEDIQNIKADKMDFGPPVYFMTEQQFNYCLWHLCDYNKTQERSEKAEAAIKAMKPYARHEYGCPLSGDTFTPGYFSCTCGLQSLMDKHNAK